MVLLTTLWVGTAGAQTSPQTFDLGRVVPDVGSPTSQLLATGDGLPAGTLRLSLLLHYEKDPLVFYRSGARVGALVGDRLTAQLGVAWAPLDWLELGLGVPVVAYQKGDTLSGQGLPTAAQSGLGAPLIQGRFTFLRQERGAPVDLGATLGLSLPVGSAAAFARDPGVGVAAFPRVGVGRAFGLIRLGAEVGAGLRQSTTLYSYAVTVQDQVGSTLGFGLTATTTNAGLRGELTVRATAPLTKTGAAVELLAGARAPLPHGFEVFALLGPGLGSLPGLAAFTAVAGVGFTPLAPPRCVEGQSYELSSCPALDRDADGVANATDLCPTEPGLPSLGGCADRDDDGDGLLNLTDTCPKVAGVAAEQGCPVRDADGDGLADSDDACPAQAGAKGTQGCPDRDADGVPDAQDACPDAVGPAAGCPDVDTDGDGVVDRLDACPALPGSDANGCGVPPAVVRKGDQIVLVTQLRFQAGQQALPETWRAALDALAKYLKDHPEIARLRIESHTDDLGPHSYNVTLSQQRAELVRASLVARGIDGARLEAQGLGPDRPLQPNDSPASRDVNRRIELHVVQSN